MSNLKNDLAQTVKNNPLPFTLGAVVAGYALSRLFTKRSGFDLSRYGQAKDVENPSLHTGIHLR